MSPTRTNCGPTTADQRHCRPLRRRASGRPPCPPHRCPQLWTTVWTCLHAGRMPSTNRERNAIGSQRESVSTTRLREMQLSDQEHVWTAVAQLLRAQLTESVWFSTFQDVVPLVSDETALVVQVPSTLAPRPHPQLATCRSSPRRSTRSGIGRPSLRCPDRAWRVGRRSVVRRALDRPVGVQHRQRQRQEGDRRVLERTPCSTRPVSTRATRSRRSSRGRRTSSPLAAALRVAETPAPFVQPAVHLRRRRVSARPICCTPSGTTCTTTTSTTRCATSRPRRS